MLLASTTKQVKAKRRRVNDDLPMHVTSVEYRIKKIQNELTKGMSEEEVKRERIRLKWESICNDVKRMNNRPTE